MKGLQDYSECLSGLSWPKLFTEIVLTFRSCLPSHILLLGSNSDPPLIRQIALCRVLHEIRQDPASYPLGMRPGQDWKLLILARGDLQDLAVQRKTWLTADLTALGSSFPLPPGMGL